MGLSETGRFVIQFLGLFLLVSKVFVVLLAGMNSFFGPTGVGWAQFIGLAFGLTLGAAIGLRLDETNRRRTDSGKD